jgi:multidrug efflux pump subunit AcrB
MSLRKILKFFSSRHLLTNVLFFGILSVAAIAWMNISKEELPEFAFDFMRVNTYYPGAPAEDIELFITKPIEEELKSVSGLYKVRSTSSFAKSAITVSIDPDSPDKKQVFQDIKDAVLRTDLPAEVRNIPTFFQFRSSTKAIIDIALIHKNAKYLDQITRTELQKYVLSFENQLMALPEISSIAKSDYLSPEFHILMNPDKLKDLEISIAQIRKQIRNNHIRVPIGTLKDRGESKVTAVHELDSIEAFNNLVLRGSYSGPTIKLSQVATIKKGFNKSTAIEKVNGHEAITLNIRKASSTDILSAKEAVENFVKQFRATNADSPIEIVLMDDESYDVTNRLGIIFTNGIIGFTLILFVLFFFLDFKSGIWVAMGIPFSLAFTIILTLLAGYSVNNMTLAGIIIVMGIVVDDAIIIAENILRHRKSGKSLIDAAVIGTREVFQPILASIITTCVAFIPLLFFEGHFGKFVSFIPLIIVFMLMGSLLESIFILPSHLIGKTPFIKNRSFDKKDWFLKYEKKYESFLTWALNKKTIIFSFFMLFLLGTGYLFTNHMKFVMFPREETKELFIKLIADESSTRYETAKLMEPVENIFINDKSNIVVATRSSVGKGRRGKSVNENEGWLRVELVPANDRNVSLPDLLKEWEKQANSAPGFKKVKFFKTWFGYGSGSAIELLVQENSDEDRLAISEEIKAFLDKIPSLSSVEIEKPIEKKEFLFKINQQKLVQWDIDPSTISAALRSFVEGSILYTLNKGDEEVDVRLTVPDDKKTDLSELLNLKVENKEGGLIKLKSFVSISETIRPTNISRINYKRTVAIYGDLSADPELTPLEIAEKMESELFPLIYKKYPSSILAFTGEIEDTRESTGDFLNAILLTLIIIYAILVIMFNSTATPLIIMLIVPFGLAGSALAFLMHGMSVFGFFSVIGALGMIGVVINDSIIMIDKLENDFDAEKIKTGINAWIASIASTKLRPVVVTTITTVVAILPTAYGAAGYDSMLAEMMLAMGWGLAFSTIITLLLVPSLYCLLIRFRLRRGSHV